MSQIDGYEFPEDLYFDEHMQYARAEGDVITIGLSDFAQKTAKEIAFVGLPRPGRKVETGKPFASVESGKWVGRLYAPVNGDVLAANQALDDDPELINRDPYGEGWIVRIKAADPASLAALHRPTDPDFAAWFAVEKTRQLGQ
jgi:glycine cleavage system H protein